MEVLEVDELMDGGAAGLADDEGAEAAALSWAALFRSAAVEAIAPAGAAAATGDDAGGLLEAAAAVAAAAAVVFGSSSEGAPALFALLLLLLMPPPWCESAAASGMGGDVDEREAADAWSCAEDERRRQGPEPREGEAAQGVGGVHMCKGTDALG